MWFEELEEGIRKQDALLSTDTHVSSLAQASGRNTVVLEKCEPTHLLR